MEATMEPKNEKTEPNMENFINNNMEQNHPSKENLKNEIIPDDLEGSQKVDNKLFSEKNEAEPAETEQKKGEDIVIKSANNKNETPGKGGKSIIYIRRTFYVK